MKSFACLEVFVSMEGIWKSCLFCYYYFISVVCGSSIIIYPQSAFQSRNSVWLWDHNAMCYRNVEKLIDNMLKNCLHEIRIFIPVSIQGDEIKNEYICEKVAIALIAAKASEGCLRCFNHMQWRSMSALFWSVLIQVESTKRAQGG